MLLLATVTAGALRVHVLLRNRLGWLPLVRHHPKADPVLDPSASSDAMLTERAPAAEEQQAEPGTDLEPSERATSLRTSRRRPQPLQLSTSGTGGMTADYGLAGDFVAYGATQVGLSHRRIGEPREDAYSLGASGESGWALLAVSDGAGSTRSAHSAARLATRAAINEMQAAFNATSPYIRDEQAWHEVSEHIMLTITEVVTEFGIDEFASEIGHQSPAATRPAKQATAPGYTLSIVALGPPHVQQFPIYWAAVGDCDVLTLDRQTLKLTWLTENDGRTGPLISNRANLLPRQLALVKSGCLWVSDQTIALIASDGCAKAIRRVPDQFARILVEHAQSPPPARVFAELVDFELNGLHDDRTLVASWPSRGSGSNGSRHAS